MRTRFRIIYQAKTGQTKTEELDTQSLFEDFIIWQVSTLVERGLVREGEAYLFHITPRYDEMPRYGKETVFVETPDKPWLEADERQGWLSEPQIRKEPMRYFTLNLRTSPRGVVYVRDFPLEALNQTIFRHLRSSGSESGGALQDDWTWKITALGIETEQFPDYDLGIPASVSLSIHLEPQSIHTSDESREFTDETLGISVEDIAVELPTKSMPSGRLETRGNKIAGDLTILISKNTFSELERDSSGRLDSEAGGLLIGESFRDRASGDLVTHITGYISAKSSKGSVGLFSFTSEAWNGMLHLKDRNYPDKAIVGWYLYSSLINWLSKDAEFIHRNFFKEPWHVVLMQSIRDDSKRFFEWKGGQIVPCNSFRIIE